MSTTTSPKSPVELAFYDQLVKIAEQCRQDYAAALKEVERLQRERNQAWEELRQAGLRPPWPRG